MITRSHVRKPLRSLKLIAKKFVRMTLDKEVHRRMHQVWLRKKVTARDTTENLGDFYEEAFAEFLNVVKIPKQVPKITRHTVRLRVRETVAEQLQQLQRIAIKRQQPLAVVIEDALNRYLDKPENYLGADEEPRERVERIV